MYKFVVGQANDHNQKILIPIYFSVSVNIKPVEDYCNHQITVFDFNSFMDNLVSLEYSQKINNYDILISSVKQLFNLM